MERHGLSAVLFIVIYLTVSRADELTLLRDEIADIRNILGHQREKIIQLESVNEVLKTKIFELNEEDELLKNKVMDLSGENEVLKNDVLDLKAKVSKLKEIIERDDSFSSDNTIQGKMTESSELSRARRLLLPNTASPPVEPIAFYAYMSKSESTPSNHHTLIFDVIKTNLGNGYNKHSGTFVAPAAGAYVFTWTINGSPSGAHYINLMVNSAIVGGSLTDTTHADDYDSDSSTVVVALNTGDSVNLRTTLPSYGAIIYVDNHAFTCFSGWRI